MERKYSIILLKLLTLLLLSLSLLLLLLLLLQTLSNIQLSLTCHDVCHCGQPFIDCI